MLAFRMGNKAQAIAKLTSVAEELELAARHCRTAVEHFSKEEIVHGCAHLLATQQRISVATDSITEAETHICKK